ncbi:hypothetical protein SAMN05444360_11630 [Chryseobacterium carnipullorum]|uniref:hypothetical protein n=1 Tax=Chryseobacterium carnipullorum TaxID=1124835 RepID=UPI000914DAC0|nr:hypothetical protein [Chryseobacterium carnipullorum]SHM70703.1 hypothetical protein SAMN05444360_11630 [Chryseobacterium carnipullorum]
MKKALVTISLFCSVFFFSQKNMSYLQISYGSICCGTPSTKPVTDYLKKFEKRNRIKSFEVLRHGGLGREGEFNLYIGTDRLGKKQKMAFVKGLESAVALQNKNRKKDSDGTVSFDSSVIVGQSDLTNIKNLTIYK